MKLLIKYTIKALGVITLFLISLNSYSQKTYVLSRNDSALLKQYDESYQKQQSLGYLKEATNFLNLSAMLYWKRNHFDKAEEKFLKSLALNKKLANRNGIAMINNNLAMIYADKKDYTKSLNYFEETLLARRVNKEKIGIISALINQSVVYTKLKRFDESIKNLEEALDLAREMNDDVQMRSCYGMLSETYQKAGDTKKSLYYYEYFRTFNNYVTNKTLKKSKKELEIERLRAELAESETEKKDLELFKTNFELKQKNEELSESNDEIEHLLVNLTKKELAIKVIKSEAKIKELKAKQEIEAKQKIILYFVFILIFIIIIGGILLYAYREKKKANKKLERKNKEILEQNQEILQQKEEILVQTEQLKESNEILSNQNEEILEQNQEILQQKEEILAQTEQLKETNNKLQELNEMKQALSEMLVHDLKSPLSSIINLSKKKEIVNAGNQMFRIVSNILDVQKYEEATMPLSVKNTSLLQIIEKVHLQVDYLALYKNIEIVNNFNRNIYLRIDEEITERIFINLLTNAIKFTPENGIIRLSAENNTENEDLLLLKVHDNGIGIRAEKIDSIFEKFVQIDARKSGKANSTGLGLTFCKMAVEAHGGNINVQSIPNKYTEFVFTLPKGINTSGENTLVEEAQPLNKENPLNKKEIIYLSSFIEKFKEYNFFEITSLQEINDEIDENFSIAVKKWKNEMDTIIYRCNEKLFNDAITQFS